MASEWVMYISVIAIGVIAISGVTLTFNAININTIESTVEVGLNDVLNTVAEELKNVLELGMSTDPQTRVAINRTLSLPIGISGHHYEISFKVLPGAKHWFMVAIDSSDSSISEIPFETTIPWQDVSLVNKAGTGLPLLYSESFQQHIDFIRAAGSNTFTIYIW